MTDKSDEQVYLPEKSYELIEWLDGLYPERCIGENETPEQAHRYAGARQLISELKDMMEEEAEYAVANRSKRAGN